MVSTEEILITMLGKDEVTPVVNNIQGNINSTFNGMSQSASASASSIGQAYQSVFDQIGRGLSSLNQGMMGISSVSNMMLSELGATKSASEYVFGTTSVAETNKVLMRSWADAKVSYEDLYKTVDTVTDSSLTSMQELVPAMNAFKASTNATGTQLKDDVAENMAQFGAYVLALTGSQQLAKTAMTDLSKGLVGKGSFNAVDQYGVTRASLEARGWSGKNEDIKGYMEAVRQVSGQVEELMNTSQGTDALMGKMWSRAGKRIGQEALPFVVDLKNAFMELDDEMEGNLSTNILRVGMYIEQAQRKLYMFNTLWDGVKNIGEAFNSLKTILGFTSIEQDANNLAQEENNRLLEESNRRLMENTDLRLANADAMSMQNLQSEGYMPYSDAMGYTPEMEAEGGGWGSDVLANTAGGLLESKYDKLRYGSGDSGEDTITPSEYMKSFGNVHPNDKVVGKTSFLDDSYYRELFQSKVSSEGKIEFPRTFDNKFLSDVEDEIQERDRIVSSLKQVSSRGDELAEEITGMTNLGIHGQSFIQKSNQASAGATKILKDITPDIDTGELDEAVDGPFRRLHTFLTEKKKRQVPDINPFEGIGDSANQIEKSGIRSFRKLRLSFTNMKKNITDLQGDTKIDTLDNIWDGLTNSFRSIGVKLGLIKAEEDVVATGVGLATTGAGVIDGEMVLMNGAMASMAVEGGVASGQLAMVNGELVILDEEMGAVAISSGALATESEVAGGEMTVAETGVTWMGLAESGLAGAFQTLIVPTLAIAGVIAILIPIIAGLVAEALFFINLIGQFMASLDWDFDISGVAEKFQELGTALAWLGVAMASMSFAGIMTGLAYIFTGFGNVKEVLGQAVSMLRDTVGILNQFQYETQIDPNVATNLSNLGSALNGVTMALGSLVGVQFMASIGNILTGFGRFGTLTDTFKKAQTDLQEAINVINQMDFTGIDETKVQTIKTTLDAISSFADAFKGLNDIRTTDDIGGFTSWLFNGGLLGGKGQSIKEAFASAKKDIEEASEALSMFDGENIKAPKQKTVDNLTRIGDSVKSVADTINGLRQLRDAYNWDDWVGGIWQNLGGNGGGISDVFAKVQTDLVTVSKALKNLGGKGGLAKVDEKLPEKLNTISSSVSGVATAINNIQSIPPVKQSDMGPKIREGVGSVQLAINGLGRFKGQTLDETIPTLLGNVAKGVTGLATVINGALSIPTVDKTVISTKITNAVDSVQSIVDGLGKLKGQSVSADINEALQQISTAVNTLKTTLNNTNFSPQGKHMGSSLKSGVSTGMNGLNAKIKTQLTNAVNHSGAYGIGKKMGKSVTNGFKAGLNLLDAITSKLSEIDLGSLITDFVTGGGGDDTGNEDTGMGSLFMEDSRRRNPVQKYRELNNNPKSNVGRVKSLDTMNSGSNLGNTQKNVNINIGEGAIKLDARNLTTKESKQVMINALEGLSMVNNIDVNGA